MRALLLVLGILAAAPVLAAIADNHLGEHVGGRAGDHAGEHADDRADDHADDHARALAATCSGCHGSATGTAEAPAALSLATYSKAELAGQLLAFKAGSRDATIMDRISRGYTQQELTAIANVLGQP
ncbi:MAG: hypothetical protein NWR61_06505 [Pseudomonadales bacterium]|nr:hypothetical protein [Pseudomonadales bacterium]